SGLPGVEVVRPLADPKTSVAYLYLDNDGLPDVEGSHKEFVRVTNGSYGWRGVEMTLEGAIRDDGGRLSFPKNADRPDVSLAPVQLANRVQLDTDPGSGLP